MELTKYNWFHGKMTEEQVESALSIGNCNHFLVRQSGNYLILSTTIKGWRHHYVINRSPRGYCLEGKNEYFKSVSKLLKHYQKIPIDDKNDQVLGTACDRKYFSGTSIIRTQLGRIESPDWSVGGKQNHLVTSSNYI